MMRFRCILCLLTLWAVRGDPTSAELQQQIAELRQQMSVMRMEMQEQVAMMSARKLAETTTAAPSPPTTTTTTLPPSLYGENRKDHRGYTKTEELSIALDHAWLILCGALVMFMQAGFAMVESGCCRAKNVQNILLKNLTDVAMGTLGWWCSGWAFAYSGPMDSDGKLANKFIGSSSWFGSGFLEYTELKNEGGDALGVYEPTTNMLNWFFQWAFCSASATIVSGGVAERVKFRGYCIFSFWMTAFMYPVVVAWTWGYGFLQSINDVGYMDFAGSGIVHMSGGVGALVGAVVAGPRAGRFENPDDFTPHSMPLVVLGTMILWFGWYGFNCGSTLAMSSASKGFLAAQVAMNTTIAAATGGLVVFVLRLAITRGKYDIGGFCNGILAGLVAITAGCGNVEVGSAFAIAIIGGFVYQGTSTLLQKIGVDDPIDAFAVHGATGAWGTIAASLFDWGSGVDSYSGWSGFSCVLTEALPKGKCLSGANGMGIGANFAQVVIITAWIAFWSVMVFVPLRLVGFLTADVPMQLKGFDEVKHSPPKAYVVELDADRERRQQEEQARIEEEQRKQQAASVKKQAFKPVRGYA
eukprot:TRINITY_DN11908_c0_g2_i1.p1 TRINITY_DN11908_c0_g2~~TRINITY_DN11908_c0_g2_i1.p1  ORF type:complete len:583 (+),score=121.11 TRINITY_DN11908_c0_g2_i1:78-1826(+)